ncbi:MAG: LPP20 family lipoprotein [Candidatus Marinimicrobia bacterium]|nr:LPP20 family lipoprotein [Candidatus Neomarinimicrobiota bacterium]
MVNSIKSIFVILSLGIILACSSAGVSESAGDQTSSGPKPAWLKSYPVDPGYYIGIGSASKTQIGSEAQKSAQDLALADLASQITVTITSDIVTRLIEKGTLTEEEYLATARSQAVADLEGHELVDSWQDQNYYYAYYRLSKAKYAAIQAKKRAAAMGLAKDYFLKSLSYNDSRDFSGAFNASIQAFIPLVPYLNEALEIELDGKTLIMSNEINQQLNDLLTDIKLSPNHSSVKGKLGKALDQKLLIQAEDGMGNGIYNLPLKAVFITGAGDLVNASITDKSGSAPILVGAIKSGEKTQIIEVSVDIRHMSKDVSPILQSIIGSIPLAATQVIIEVTNPTIYLSASEIFDGQTIAQAQIEPKLKHHFIEKGFHFVDQPSKADWLMNLKATATPGIEYSGMFTVFADVSLNVVDRTTGKEIYKDSISRIKGIDLNYANAANKALSNAAEKLNASILPQIMVSLN